jgi:type IV secretory pathway VirB4 component
LAKDSPGIKGISLASTRSWRELLTVERLKLEQERVRKDEEDLNQSKEVLNRRREACNKVQKDVHVQRSGNQKFLTNHASFCMEQFGGDMEFGPMPPVI